MNHSDQKVEAMNCEPSDKNEEKNDESLSEMALSSSQPPDLLCEPKITQPSSTTATKEGENKKMNSDSRKRHSSPSISSTTRQGFGERLENFHSNRFSDLTIFFATIL